MTLSPNQEDLIGQIETSKIISSRYENLRCINRSANSVRGMMSLVFQGYDKYTNEFVAIKMMDPDKLGDSYRIAAFQREPKLLEKVLGKTRCLQLVDGIQNYQWIVKPTIGDGATLLKIECNFFVTEWIEEDIDDYFYRQDTLDPVAKLVIFRKLLLAVRALHRLEIFHRDLKIDNIRLKSVGEEQVVVVIDYGTAASADATKIASDYVVPVGAKAFSPPEAFVGFSGDRNLGKLADIYALGALFFDLFNTKEFRNARFDETNFDKLLIALGAQLSKEATDEGRLICWRKQMRKFQSFVTHPVIDGPGNSIPSSITYLIKRIYESLIEFDFNKRLENSSCVLKNLDSAITVLKNSRSQSLQLQRKKILRRKRQRKIQEKQERLLKYLSEKDSCNA